MRRIGNVKAYEALQYMKRIESRGELTRGGTVNIPVKVGTVEIWRGRKYVRMKWLDRNKLVLHKFTGTLEAAAKRLAELEPDLDTIRKDEGLRI